MAVTVEASFPVVTGGTAPDNTTITQSIAVGAGANRLMLLWAIFDTQTPNVSTAVFNGSESLSFVDAIEGGSFTRIECWQRIAPSNTTANLVVTPAGGPVGFWSIVTYVLDGVDQTVPLSTPAKGTAGSGTTVSHTPTGFASGDQTFDMLALDSTGHSPVITGNNVGDFAVQNLGAGTIEYRGSHDTTDGIMSWSWTTSCINSHLAVIAKQAGGAANQQLRPDADTDADSWTTTPLWSKVDEASAGGDVITATAS